MLRAARLLFLNIFILNELCLRKIKLVVWNAQQLFIVAAVCFLFGINLLPIIILKDSETYDCAFFSVGC